MLKNFLQLAQSRGWQKRRISMIGAGVIGISALGTILLLGQQTPEAPQTTRVVTVNPDGTRSIASLTPEPIEKLEQHIETAVAATTAVLQQKEQEAGDSAATSQTAENDEADSPAAHPYIKELTVGRGDTLMNLLTKQDLSRQQAYQAITALRKIYDPRDLRVGQTIEVSLLDQTEGPSLQSLSIQLDKITTVSSKLQDGAFTADKTTLPLVVKDERAGGTIDISLYAAAQANNLPINVMMELIQIYSFDVDFQREIQPGDKFEVFYKRQYTEAGVPVKEGRIEYAKLTLSGRDLELYHYTPKDDRIDDYFDPRGQSIKKALMRTPINGARLSSGFGKRRHPILGYTKMHKGIDFAAPTGTPIKAAGDGRIEVAGWNGGYGKYVRIRHNSDYKTAYAHMSRIRVKPGARVKQGEIIGYVGSTGRSTGAHLHYEVHKRGRQVNPLGVRLPTGRKLAGNELQRFKNHMAQVDKQIAAVPLVTKLAQAD